MNQAVWLLLSGFELRWPVPREQLLPQTLHTRVLRGLHRQIIHFIRVLSPVAATSFTRKVYLKSLDDLPEKWHSYIEKNSSYVEGGKFHSDKPRTA
jgi:hypothetical protein